MRAVWVSLGASGVDVFNDPFSEHDDRGGKRRQNGAIERG